MHLTPDSRSRKNYILRSFIRTARFISIPAFLLLIVIGVTLAPPARQTAEDPCSVAPPQGCFTPARRDLAFMIDASGSIEGRGQSYNSAIEGLIRAVNDPTSIPRDGSIAISVVVFNGAATVAVSLSDINSEQDAAAIAAKLQMLKCSSIHSKLFPCPFGQTSYTAGIKAADSDVTKGRELSPKAGVRRAFVLITDGQPEDADRGVGAAKEARDASLLLGIPFEFDGILIGLDTASQEFADSKAIVDQLVFPTPTTDLPGATFAINTGDCNVEGATFGSDCSRQSNELAELVRSIVRGPVEAQSFTVNTEADTAGGAAGPVSLRSAIELANCNGGSATITFAESLSGKTIELTSPLPPLTAPGIVIDGCEGEACTPRVTIDGGGEFADGLQLRSNRDTVRGLRITNFTRSGIAIQPVCPNDVAGHNRVELNHLENNPIGVLVAQLGDDAGNTNIRNTLSRNDIVRSAPASDAPPGALIDLNGDGPTANDDGDADQGPNTLLNFPDGLGVVTGDDNTVTVSGKLKTPPSGGATVEIYGVTEFRTVDDAVVIDGASYLATATVDSAGMFSVGGVTPSSTGVYTALVIENTADNPGDQSSNTSELMFDSADTPLPKGKATVDTMVNFGDSPLGTPTSKTLDVTNDGTAPLTINNCAIGRCPGATSDNKDRFTISGCPTAPINPGETITITVTFNGADCGTASACLLLQTNDPFRPVVAITLTANGTAPAHGVIQGGITSIKFKRTSPRGAPRANPKKATFVINNTGCEELSISSASFARVMGSSTAPDDSGTFSLATSSSVPLTIPPRGSRTFTVQFNPVIPRVVQSGTPAVKDILPDDVTDQLTLQAANGDRITLTLLGQVRGRFLLIDPNNPANAPVITLCQSGNEFVVTFSAFDANLNLSRASYQFLNRSGQPIGGPIAVDVQQAIASRNLTKGQSITISQRFTGARDNRVSAVDVTIEDGESIETVRAQLSGSGCASSLSLRGSGTLIALPEISIDKAFSGGRRKGHARR